MFSEKGANQSLRFFFALKILNIKKPAVWPVIILKLVEINVFPEFWLSYLADCGSN